MRRQHRAILLALLDGPINTATSVKRAGISAWSQRAGELERMGLVTRYRVSVSETSAPVVEAKLTERGREIAIMVRDGDRSGTITEGIGNTSAGREAEPNGARTAPPIQARGVPEPTGARAPAMVPPQPERPAPGSLFPAGPVRHDRAN